MSAKRILIAPLNWGLGHATRCIPLIRWFQREGHTVIIASDGPALELLKEEFPNIQHVELPHLEMNYPKGDAVSKLGFTWKTLIQAKKFDNHIKADHHALSNYLQRSEVDAIISDNRYGVYSEPVPSVLLTHQLSIHASFGNIAERKIEHWTKKFDRIWIPDTLSDPNLTGDLTHSTNSSRIQFIGPLSRLSGKSSGNQLTVLISGPSPQKERFLQLTLESVKRDEVPPEFECVNIIYGGEARSGIKTKANVYLNPSQSEIEKILLSSSMVISRPGYTTVMDINKIATRGAFVPTPGQPEQLYLASYYSERNWYPSIRQKEFALNNSQLHDKAFTAPSFNYSCFADVLNQFIIELK